MFNFRHVLISIGLAVSFTAQAIDTMRIGTNVWPGYEPFYLAQSLEGWDKGNKIQLVEYATATEVLRAFRNKTIEAAALTLDEALLLRESKMPIQIVLVTDISNGGDVIMATPDIQTFSDIKGKRVGVEGGALGAYVLTRALEVHGLALEDIQIIHVGVDAHESVYRQGKVDAVVTFEPVRTKLKNLGAQEIFSSREIPGEVVDVLVVHDDYLAKSPERVRTLIKGWYNALTYLKKQPELAAKVIAQRLKVTPQEALDSFEGLHLPSLAETRKLLGGVEPKLNPVLQRMQKTMLEQELLIDSVSLDKLLNPAYLNIPTRASKK